MVALHLDQQQTGNNINSFMVLSKLRATFTVRTDLKSIVSKRGCKTKFWWSGRINKESDCAVCNFRGLSEELSGTGLGPRMDWCSHVTPSLC